MIFFFRVPPHDPSEGYRYRAEEDVRSGLAGPLALGELVKLLWQRIAGATSDRIVLVWAVDYAATPFQSRREFED